MRLLRSIGILTVPMLVACGGGGGGGPAGPSSPNTPNTPTNPSTPAPSGSANVLMVSSDDGYTEAHRFSPTSVSITRGGSVTWTNGTSIVHNVTFSGSGAPANIGDHASGTNSRTFESSGTFGFQCTNHTGMTGTVAVQ